MHLGQELGVQGLREELEPGSLEQLPIELSGPPKGWAKKN